MSVSPSTVTAIVVSYNTCDLTRRALLALKNSHTRIQRIIVVDNASRDGSASMVKKEFPDVMVIENAKNVGFAVANNQALKQCTQTYAWLVNSDTEVHKDTLQALVAYLDMNETVAMVGPQLVYPDGSLQSVGGYFPTVSNVLRYLIPITSVFPRSLRARYRDIALFPQIPPKEGIALDYVTGAACLLRVSALKEVGFLGEEYFMYFEETDLAWRLKARGYTVMAIATPPVMHVYGGSYKRAHDSARLKQFLRSLSLFVRKYYTGVRRYTIMCAIAVLGPLSILVKTTFRRS